MEVTLRHGLEYQITDSVAVEDLVQSLQAHARLLRSTSEVLSEVVPGLTVEAKRVSVVHVSQESPLRELFAFSTVVTYQKELEQEVPQLIEQLTGVQVSDQYDTLITVFVMLVAIYGISTAFERLFPGRSKKNLDEARDGLLKRAAELTQASSHRIMAAIEVLFTGRSRRALVGASQKTFAPTRNHPHASIRDRHGQPLVSEAAVHDAQAASGMPIEENDPDNPKTTTELHRNVRIILHAMDKDRKRRGWAGHCPELFDDRIPMHLEKAIAPEAIFGKGEAQGDILLTSEEDENGDMQPKEFLLLQVSL